MGDGLLDRLGLGAVAGFAIGVAVSSSPGEQRTLRDFARDILAECNRLLEDPRVAAALPAIPATAEPAAPRRRRRTRAQIEADAAAAAAAASPAAAEPPARRRRGRAAGAATTNQTRAAGAPAVPAEQPARRARRPRQQPTDTGNGRRAAAPAAGEETTRARGAEDRETESATAGDDRLNLNTASRGQLMRLPRIGAQAADRIIAFREENGPIRNIRQLRQAEVIPVSAARQIRELVQF